MRMQMPLVVLSMFQEALLSLRKLINMIFDHSSAYKVFELERFTYGVGIINIFRKFDKIVKGLMEEVV